MADEAPGTRRRTTKSRNLLQWLRLREMRPIRNYNMPMSILEGLKFSLEREDGNTSANTFVAVGMHTRSLREEIQFKPESHLRNVLLRLISGWTGIKENYFLKEVMNFNFALDHGLLEICFHLLRRFYSQCEANSKLTIRSSCFLLLWKLIGQARRQNRSRSVEYASKEIETILRCEKGLMFSLALVKSSKQLTYPFQANFQMAVSLAGDLCLEAPDAFYCLYRKFKEGIYFEICSFKFGDGFHSLLKMCGGLRSLVQEAYCLGSCIESLFRQPCDEEARHRIVLASLRLRDLLFVIYRLLSTYPLYCCCEACRFLSKKVIFAGLPRVIHVLFSIIINISIADLYLIEAIFENLSAIVIKLIINYSDDLTMWYVMYPQSDINGLFDVCNAIQTFLPGNDNEIHYSRIIADLQDAEELIRAIPPAQYILEPPFRDIPFDLDREYCMQDLVFSIEDLEAFYTEREFQLNLSEPLTRCANALLFRVSSSLLDQHYWIEEYRRRRAR